MVFASSPNIDVARFQNQLVLIESLATFTCFAAECHHITSHYFHGTMRIAFTETRCAIFGSRVRNVTSSPCASG